ncbi:hypothetical protein [uncultured Gimesia sp.]|uniref:hypothetical protein n=1 Tax=uncultured Gimesia sp. TaxID=1678688 RepID=UPI0030D7105F
MKSTLATGLIVLIVVCILKFDSPVSSQAQVSAQMPLEIERKSDPLFVAIEHFMEQRNNRKRHSPKAEQRERNPDPETVKLLAEGPHLSVRHQQERYLHEERRHQEARREQEHHLQQQKHRIENMHLAARHLKEAGMHDLSHQVHREATEQEHRLREEAERAMQHDAHRQQSHQEIHEFLHQLRNEVRELKQEVNELRKIVADQHRKPEIEEEQILR